MGSDPAVIYADDFGRGIVCVIPVSSFLLTRFACTRTMDVDERLDKFVDVLFVNRQFPRLPICL